jgi:tRNA U34 5-carboxymethylaminomethyl modifying enzyme MnmG/GidA
VLPADAQKLPAKRTKPKTKNAAVHSIVSPHLSKSAVIVVYIKVVPSATPSLGTKIMRFSKDVYLQAAQKKKEEGCFFNEGY